MWKENQQCIQEKQIKPDVGKSLQQQVDAAIQEGCQRIYLEGEFIPEQSGQFSLLTLTHDLEIIGPAIFDGQNKVQHLLFVADGVRVVAKDLIFKNGDTGVRLSEHRMLNHPQQELNVFRYLDGGAITMGEGSEVVLENCAFQDNRSLICAGAISNMGGMLTANNCAFIGNQCGDTGSAVDLLVAGSAAEIFNCTFVGNRSDLSGKGTHGVITAFPNTMLVVIQCNFSRQVGTAIDATPNVDGETFLCVEGCTFIPGSKDIENNPLFNKGVKAKIILRFIRLLIQFPGLVKLQTIPSVRPEIADKHFSRLMPFI